MRLVRCKNCSMGLHGDCALSYCTCPIESCEKSRLEGAWKKYIHVMEFKPTLHVTPDQAAREYSHMELHE